LIRYLHLNPLRAKVITDLRALDRYPWTGHSALLGAVPRPWQATQEVLARFSPTLRRARTAYRTFVAVGIPQGRRPELQGGGLIRSLGGWHAVQALRRGREAYLGDERVLGSSEFVEHFRREAEAHSNTAVQRVPLERLVTRVCRHVGVDPTALRGGGRAPEVIRARNGIAYLWVEVLGRPGRPLAPVLGVRPQNVYQAAKRGAQTPAQWTRMLVS